MKKIFILACFLVAGFTQAQDTNPLYEIEGDLVKVTHFYDNGAVKEQGYFKDKKLTGTWTTFNIKGDKTAIAHYNNGKKVGKWFIWDKEGLKEINYENYTIASVQTWKQDTRIAVK